MSRSCSALVVGNTTSTPPLRMSYYIIVRELYRATADSVHAAFFHTSVARSLKTSSYYTYIESTPLLLALLPLLQAQYTKHASRCAAEFAAN
eukprot:6176914-Pleurochrysis_carterae.AAC.5